MDEATSSVDTITERQIQEGMDALMKDRILKYTEILVQDYLNQEMCNGQPPQGKFDLFIIIIFRT